MGAKKWQKWTLVLHISRAMHKSHDVRIFSKHDVCLTYEAPLA